MGQHPLGPAVPRCHWRSLRSLARRPARQDEAADREARHDHQLRRRPRNCLQRHLPSLRLRGAGSRLLSSTRHPRNISLFSPDMHSTTPIHTPRLPSVEKPPTVSTTYTVRPPSSFIPRPRPPPPPQAGARTSASTVSSARPATKAPYPPASAPPSASRAIRSPPPARTWVCRARRTAARGALGGVAARGGPACGLVGADERVGGGGGGRGARRRWTFRRTAASGSRIASGCRPGADCGCLACRRLPAWD